MNKLKITLLVSILTLVTACSNIPLSTMIKMMNLNPLEADPKQLVVAVVTSEGIDVRDGDIVIDFSFRTGDPSTSFAHNFPVIINDNYTVPGSLKGDVDGNEKVTVMQLSKENAQTMSEGQQAVKEYRRKNEGGGAGSMNVRVVSACRENNFTWGNSELNVYLKTQDGEDFFLFLEDMDVTKLDTGVQRKVAIPECERTTNEK
ncbi:hypothetical protein [Idiomarina sp.]|uniref:hypothetical protein n=1 Tax=Idiomarina sp. TaxID=1874361 RepID=UPI002587551A|nr:hypothetical protein [Idiomarina sp.]